MTDELLSLILAQHFEPRPERGSADLPDQSCTFWWSPLRFWRSKSCFDPKNDGTFYPVNMVTDPAMTVMLMEKLAESPQQTRILLVGHMFTLNSGEYNAVARSMSEFARAVAMAFADLKGLL